MSPPRGTMDINAHCAKNDKHVEHASNSEVPEFTAICDAMLEKQRVGESFGHVCWKQKDGQRVVAQMVDAFVELIADFGAPIAVQESFRGCATKFLLADDEITYWGRAKNLVCFFKAKFLKNPLPDVAGYHFGGAWKKWAQSRMHFSRKNVALWSSTFKLKNAAARLTERAAVVTMHKHAASVGKRMATDKPVIEKTVRTIFPLLERAARFIGKQFDEGSWDQPFAASNSACVEASKKDFGQIGHFMERVFGPGAPLVVPGISFCGTGPQQRAVGSPLSTVFLDDDVHQARLAYIDREELPVTKTVDFYECIVVDGRRYENCWFETFSFPSAEKVWMNEIFIDALKACDRDLALAKVACVLEPFKVRIITKGEAALQYMSGFFQKSIFEFNKTVSCFGLVGRSPSTFDLIDIRDNCGRGNPDSAFGPHSLYKWASSDFSGASDGTNGYYRDCIMDVLIMFLPPHIQAIIQASNGEHLVSYPGSFLFPSMADLGEIADVHQTLGTLMGERTSFPILCFEVLAAHVSNLRRCGDVRDLDDILKGVRINGDDRLAISTDSLESEFWEFCERYLGFKESKGKSYTHSDYANINSQSYICNVISGTPWKVPVRASGLEHGQKKLDEAFDPTSVITQVLDGCFNAAMEWTVLQRFLVRFAIEAERIAAGRNLFVHQSLGGLGNRLPVRHGKKRCVRANGEVCGHPSGSHWKVCVTLEQRFVAGALLEAPNAVTVPYGPCFQEAASLPQLMSVPWDVYGKPTYWNTEEFELKEMAHRYQAELARYDPDGGRNLPSVARMLQSRLRTLDGGGFETLVHVVDNVQLWTCPECRQGNRSNDDCQCGWTRTAWQCDTCLMWNPESGMACRVCAQFGHPMALVEIQTRPRHKFESRVTRNVSISRPQLARLGYDVPELDDFDHSLYSHAIECARMEYEGFPTVRYKGRAVDLWGENPDWAPLRPAHLVWH